MSAALGACGIITLTTDFGQAQPFVGVMKGRVLSRFPQARIVDLSHEMPAYRPAEAGFWLERAFGYFPPGTVHVAVVDPGVGTARRLLIASMAGHCFLAPDNGLLGRLLSRHPGAEVWQLMPEVPGRLGLHEVSATFHGRDLFAPLAAELAAGRCQPQDLGAPLSDPMPSPVAEPICGPGFVRGAIVSIDAFGNLISNLEASLIAAIPQPHVYCGGQVLPLRRTYGEVPPGEYLALINSFGVLEVARSQGSAAEGLGVARDSPLEVRATLRTAQCPPS